MPRQKPTRPLSPQDMTLLSLTALAVVVLLCAYFMPPPAEHQRRLVNVFYQITAASVGWAYSGGIFLSFVTTLGVFGKLAVRAGNSIALWTLAMLFPIFPAPAIPNPPLVSITTPTAESTVGKRVSVCGHSSAIGRIHQILVQPQGGLAWIQDGVMIPSAEGHFCGVAAFGNVSVGAGEPYTIQIAAVRTPVSQGETLPKDVLFSAPVTVYRANAEGFGQ